MLLIRTGKQLLYPLMDLIVVLTILPVYLGQNRFENYLRHLITYLCSYVMILVLFMKLLVNSGWFVQNTSTWFIEKCAVFLQFKVGRRKKQCGILALDISCSYIV